MRSRRALLQTISPVCLRSKNRFTISPAIYRNSLVCVSEEGLELDETEDETKARDDGAEEFEDLCEAIKDALGNKVEVTAHHRFTLGTRHWSIRLVVLIWSSPQFIDVIIHNK